MNEFAAWLRSLGLRPGTVAPDGKWRRCSTEAHPKKKNGAYRLTTDGRIGWAQDWSTMSEVAVWRLDREASVPVLDLDALRRAKAGHEEMQRRAIVAAREFYAKCSVMETLHPYLAAHGLSMLGSEGLKVDRDGWLVVPAFHGKEIQTVQRISPTGEKRFWPGAPVSGSWFTIGRKPPWSVTVMCEGYATGAACYAALVGDRNRGRVIVLWNTGNMEKAAARLPGHRVIAADNDHETEARTGKNPGIETARRIAQATGCGVSYPTGIKGTDWADWRQERRAQLALRSAANPYQTRGQVERVLDAEMTRLLVQGATFVVTA